ncbi:acyl-CoA dehydrogenase [Streptomyces inusitatus]|uniref:Acyl-CoA dehydrogenase n=1 Tax=Streptomyces inusitatus TaxID=68221 RepID=A0A918PWT0_9ACTN|nr:acyl-CoA dehydrogenase family protein [Streptomyces inusitatus]GGZ25515.1 acyl-CoA dehydrogenase [Streptomyces inusitatus]
MDTAFAALTDEQREIRRTLREVLAARCGPDRLRAVALTPAGHDPELWTRLGERLGLPGLALPEEYGGVGCGLPELALACEETGRALLPSPLLATTVLAAPLITALGSSAQRAELLPRLADASLTCALVIPGGSLATALGLIGDSGSDSGGAWAAGGGRAGGVQARPAPGGGWLLYGEAGQVLDGHSAGLLLVAAHAGGFPHGRTLLFLVRAEAPGLTRARLTALDQTRPQGRVQLRDCPAALLGDDDGPAVARALSSTGARAAALLAAESSGTAAYALERTVAHVREREQFGRPIGSFQAVRHRLADLHVQVRAARSAARYAAWDPAGAGTVALAQCLETARTATAEAVQLHGGIGFTWEHETHLYFKRAAGDELLLGPVHGLRERAAREAGLFASETPETPETPEASAFGAAR